MFPPLLSCVNHLYSIISSHNPTVSFIINKFAYKMTTYLNLFLTILSDFYIHILLFLAINLCNIFFLSLVFLPAPLSCVSSQCFSSPPTGFFPASIESCLIGSTLLFLLRNGPFLWWPCNPLPVVYSLVPFPVNTLHIFGRNTLHDPLHRDLCDTLVSDIKGMENKDHRRWDREI